MYDFNSANANSRDARIHFDEPSHSYLVDTEMGPVECDSVTTVIDAAFEQFDALKWAQIKATPQHTAEQIMAEWAKKGEIARNAGTLLHDRIERHYLGKQIEEEAFQDPAFANFISFTKEVKLHPFRSEWRIFSEKYRLAGTLDFLAFDGNRYEIYDWKRSSKIVDASGNVYQNSFGKHALEPLTNVPDTVYHHYALQVSIYRYILETEYHIRVEAGHLGVFHPDYNRHFVVHLPYLKDEVITLLNHRYEKLTSGL